MELQLAKLEREMAKSLDWDTVLKTGKLLGESGADYVAQASTQLDKFGEFRDLACEHMVVLVTEVLKERPGVVAEVAAKAKVVVATMDAYCKWKSGDLHGVARGILDKLQTNVALLDESEAYSIDQSLAAMGGLGAFKTVLCFGDVHQRLEDFYTNPAHTRVPWNSPDHGDGMAGIHEEEQDGDTAGAGGDKKKIPNAKRKSLQEFLLKAPTTKLSYSKRCGKLVTAFIRRLMPWAENFESDPHVADSTWLWHVVYDGQRWQPSVVEGVSGDKGGKETTGLAQSGKPAESVGWHEVLFKCLLAMCLKQMQWVRKYVHKPHKLPIIVIICPMARVAVPLDHIVGKLWPAGEVAVRMPHGVRGHDALIAHAIRHRRNVVPADPWGQYKGGPGGPGARVLDPHAGEEMDNHVARERAVRALLVGA